MELQRRLRKARDTDTFELNFGPQEIPEELLLEGPFEYFPYPLYVSIYDMDAEISTS